MKIVDISWPISPSMTAYKDKSVVQFEPQQTYEKHGVRQAIVQLGTHTGTHVDAPGHFLADGITIDKQSLSALVGKCQLIDMTHVKECITVSDLTACCLQPESIVLFKTKNSFSKPNDLFDPSFVFLDSAAAMYLVNKKIKAVGIDYLGIERGDPAHRTHTILMNASVSIVEGLRLVDVQAGSYFFVCLPLCLTGLDGAPARAILINYTDELGYLAE